MVRHSWFLRLAGVHSVHWSKQEWAPRTNKAPIWSLPQLLEVELWRFELASQKICHYIIIERKKLVRLLANLTGSDDKLINKDGSFHLPCD